ncbi:hypothetical protein ABT256_26990 [Amycolatopsis japonica]
MSRNIAIVPETGTPPGEPKEVLPMENTFELDIEQTDFDVLGEKEY